MKELKEFGVEIYGYDPLLSKEEIESFKVKALNKLNVKDARMDCVIVAVAHDEFRKMEVEDIMRMMNDKPVLIDIRGIFAGEAAKEEGFYYKRL